MRNRIGLIILDGWGIGDGTRSDAVHAANTPVMDKLLQNYPHATLKTFGENVGLPEGQMGNSEVGHLNIGAGRIVYQELTRINKSIREGEFFKNPVLLKAFDAVRESGKTLHLMGLVSDGGVHSHYEHLFALCDMAVKHQLEKVCIHVFTDGRDCDPKSGKHFISLLQEKIKGTNIRIASVSGRYYAMDRDNRWERIAKAYHAMVNAAGDQYTDAEEAIEKHYAEGITDEFIEPFVLTEDGQPVAKIENGDTVISFNFRTDRPREIAIALTQKDFPEQNMHALRLDYLTMTSYDPTFKNVRVIFEKDNLVNTLGEVLSKLDRTQLRAAETEKYPHVTFFFSGGREAVFPNESRILVNSPKVATYDLQPEMSAIELKNEAVSFLREQQPDFFCLNFANPDMVGHTGVYEAIIKAVETVDSCLGELVETGLELGYEFVVIADHGNADYAVNHDGTPNTAHSLNPVPVVLVTNEKGLQMSDGILADVAPTILRRLHIAAPVEMTGKNLVSVAEN